MPRSIILVFLWKQVLNQLKEDKDQHFTEWPKQKILFQFTFKMVSLISKEMNCTPLEKMTT